MKKKFTASGALMAIFALFWLFITAFPLYFTLVSSLKTDKQIFTNYFALPTQLHFENYQMAQQMSNILRALLNSVGVALVSIVLLLFIDVLAAYIIARKKVPLSGVWMVLLSMAIMIPLQSILIPIVQLVSQMGGIQQPGDDDAGVCSGQHELRVFRAVRQRAGRQPRDRRIGPRSTAATCSSWYFASSCR